MRLQGLLALAGLLATGVLGGCARSVFPPGGPVDTMPPRVVAITPADSSTWIPPEGAVEMLFTESMDRASVRDGLKVYPPPGRPRFDWSGRRVGVTWDRPLAPGTTYNLLLSGRVRDTRGVPMGMPVTIRFSTGAAIDSGEIRGVVRTRTLRRQGIAMLAYPDTLGPRPDTTGLEPSYEAETDTAGVYAFTGLPVGRGFTIHAFFDLNTNGSIERDADLVVSYPSVITLTPERAEADSINIVAVDPRAPAVLNGTIGARDSTARFRVEALETLDSSLVRRVERVGPGPYTLRVPAGTYRLRAIRLAPPESSEPDVVVIRPEPATVKPEEEYGPFEFVFGEVGLLPPKSEDDRENEEAPR